MRAEMASRRLITPHERPGMSVLRPNGRASAGRPAPGRWADLRSYIFLTFSGEACFGW